MVCHLGSWSLNLKSKESVTCWVWREGNIIRYREDVTKSGSALSLLSRVQALIGSVAARLPTVCSGVTSMVGRKAGICGCTFGKGIEPGDSKSRADPVGRQASWSQEFLPGTKAGEAGGTSKCTWGHAGPWLGTPLPAAPTCGPTISISCLWVFHPCSQTLLYCFCKDRGIFKKAISASAWLQGCFQT